MINTTTSTLTPCPPWCRTHPVNEPAGTHVAEPWSAYELGVSLSVHPDHGVRVGVNHGLQEGLTLTEVQAHELGMELIRVSDRLRREQLS